MEKLQKSKKHNNGRWLSWLMYLMVCVGMFLYYINSKGGELEEREVSFTQLTEYIESDRIVKLKVTDSNTATGELRTSEKSELLIEAERQQKTLPEWLTVPEVKYIRCQIPSTVVFSEYMSTINSERTANGMQAIDVRYTRESNYWYMILINFLPILIFIGFIYYMNRGVASKMGGVFGIGRANAKTADSKAEKKVTFKDVAGLSGAKEEIQEIVAFLKNPQKYTELGAKIPKGALLVGPPGTGKTLLAKAVAGEAGVPFLSMSGSDFVEMFVGVGASRVRDLFRQAAEAAPAIIFIDEIDAVGRARGKNVISGGNDERESTLNQLLTEMDGFGTNSGVIILAATNRAEILDPALLRAGRFDRQIHVELPDLQERKEIFGVHLKPIKLGKDLDIDFLAKQTPGFSGADIANVCNEAALIAARNSHKAVGKQDFMDAVDRIVGGLERKNKIMTEEEKRSIAYHEAGHATVSWMLEGANPLVKVTIVPRGIALGAAWYLPEERQLVKTNHLRDEMCATLAGRAAEELFLNQTSTGALNDLEKVNKQAYAMVAYYGMSDDLKNACYYDSTGQGNYFGNPYSEATAKKIDDAVNKLINSEMERAKKILQENAEGHHRMAELLIEKEVITTEDVEAILGPRQWVSRSQEILDKNDEGKADSKKPKTRSRKAKEEKTPEQTKSLKDKKDEN